MQLFVLNFEAKKKKVKKNTLRKIRFYFVLYFSAYTTTAKER